MKTVRQLLVASLLLLAAIAKGQTASKPFRMPAHVTYVLPDGRVLDPTKLDSLHKVWGLGRVQFEHSKEDDEKGILRVTRMTDEQYARLQQLHDQQQQAFAAMLDKPAPDFTLTDLQGKRWSLQELRGKVVVINFWFTSCMPCIKEMPDLNQLVEAYAGKEVVFLGLTYNNGDHAVAFLQKRTFRYTVLPNSSAVDSAYQISSWPTSIVIDQQGTIKKIIGSSREIRQELATAINALR